MKLNYIIQLNKNSYSVKRKRNMYTDSNFTSMHDSSGVHMFERTAELDKVLPHCSLWDKPSLLLKVL